jgi:hypothetical protein
MTALGSAGFTAYSARVQLFLCGRSLNSPRGTCRPDARAPSGEVRTEPAKERGEFLFDPAGLDHGRSERPAISWLSTQHRMITRWPR